jgi:hypothetical protein
LAVVGGHTPEFAFEKDVDNVSRAVKDMRVIYPVALDSDITLDGYPATHSAVAELKKDGMLCHETKVWTSIYLNNRVAETKRQNQNMTSYL